MIKSKVLKITDSAYFVADLEDYITTLIKYDPSTSQQTLSMGTVPQAEEVEPTEEVLEEDNWS